MFISLTTRFTALNVGLVILVSLILGVFSYFLMVSSLTKKQKEQLEYVVRSQAEQLDLRLKNQENHLKEIAGGEAVKRYAKTFQETLLHEYFDQYREELPTLTFVNEKGIEEVKIQNGVNSTALSDISTRRIYKETALEPNRVFTTISQQELPHGIPQLEIGIYQQNFFDEFEGIIIGRVPIAQMTRYIRDISIGETGFLMILDDQGIILSHGQRDVNLEQLSATGQNSTQLLFKAISMQSGFDRATLQGIDAFVAYAPVQGRQLSLVATLPYEEFSADLNILKYTFLVVFLVIFAAGILLSYFMTTAVTRPLLTLIDASKRIAHGDLTQRVYITAGDEVGLLGISFNTMVANLQHSKEELENIFEVKDAITTNLIKTQRKLENSASIQEKLIQELESKNAELERFTYTVSHDLKSPLVTIKGFVGILAQDVENGDTKRIHQDITYIKEASVTMAALLEDLLELSRIGRIVNPPEDINLQNLTDEAVRLLLGNITASGTHLKIRQNLPVIYGDRTRFLEVMQNLIENGIKFSRNSNPPRVEVFSKRENGETICCVKDNGIGIEPQYKEKIFDLFERLEPDTEGTGIGLALVKRIVEIHNGRIWVESAGKNCGSTFCFTVPEKKV